MKEHPAFTWCGESGSLWLFASQRRGRALPGVTAAGINAQFRVTVDEVNNRDSIILVGLGGNWESCCFFPEEHMGEDGVQLENQRMRQRHAAWVRGGESHDVAWFELGLDISGTVFIVLVNWK